MTQPCKLKQEQERLESIATELESIATELESIAADRVTYLVTFYALREKSKNNSHDKP